MKDIDGYVTKDSLYRLISRMKYNPDIAVDNTTCNIIIEAISDMPKEDVEPVRYAHWVECTVRGSLTLCCSDCGSDSGTLYPYDTCPNCGARMKDGGDTNG